MTPIVTWRGDIFEPDEPQTFHAQGFPCPSLSSLTSCLTLFHLLCSYAKTVITRYSRWSDLTNRRRLFHVLEAEVQDQIAVTFKLYHLPTGPVS